MPVPPEPPLRIGISSCLLGHKVRYDDGHKRDHFLADTLGAQVQWVPVCPEVEIGLGTPREAIRLEKRGNAVHLVATESRMDLTSKMTTYARRRVAKFAAESLCGYVLKSKSPSCGMERVRIYGERGVPRKVGRGLFADALAARFPNLPIEEEGRLCDPRLRENWVERVFAYHRLQSLWAGRWTRGDMVDFHTREKLLLRAHSPQRCRELRKLIAEVKVTPRSEFRRRYEDAYMAGLRSIATRGKTSNALQRTLGYFRDRMDRASREELAAAIRDYRLGHIPLIVPVTLVRHHVRVLEISYLAEQTFLNPHPKELALRNHV